MVVQDLGQRLIAQYSPEHYRRHRRKLVEKGPVKKPHADSTKESNWGMMKKWIRCGRPLYEIYRGVIANDTARHCEFLEEDRLHFLMPTTNEDIMTFLKEILDFYPESGKEAPWSV